MNLVASQILSVSEKSRLTELEGVIERGLETFVETGNALMEIRDSRLYRQEHETFERYCRSRWGMERAHAYRQIEAAQVAAALSPTGDIPANERQARELVPLKNDEHAMVEVWRELKEEHGDDVTADRVKRLVKKRLARVDREREAASPGPAPEPTGNVFLNRCDLSELDLEPNSVDLVFTDPPYPKEYLSVWNSLAGLVNHALKPGRLLVAYSGQYHLTSVMSALGQWLEYVWLGALVTPGQHNQVQRRHLRSAVKPLLFYSKGSYELGPWFDDAYISEQRAKDDHDWQQSLGAARYYIERLTKPGDVVLDPFLGSGTTAVAAQELGRTFIGCDVDEAALNTAKRRLAA